MMKLLMVMMMLVQNTKGGCEQNVNFITEDFESLRQTLNELPFIPNNNITIIGAGTEYVYS